MKHLSIVLILFLGFLSAVGQTTLQGSIYDRSTGLPLEGVQIEILKTFRETLTDASGFFSIPDMDPGVYYLKITMEGFQSELIDLEISDEYTFSIGVSLQPEIRIQQKRTVYLPQLTQKEPFFIPMSVGAIHEASQSHQVFPHVGNSIQSVNGTWMMNPYHGGAVFSVRGFGGNKTPILIDGIRLSHFGWSSYGNGNLLLLNPNQVQGGEILRGPATVQVGTDAIGVLFPSILIHLPFQKIVGRSTETSIHSFPPLPTTICSAGQ